MFMLALAARRACAGAIARLSYDMALPPQEPKAPLWLWAVGIVVGFALGAGLAYLLVR